MASGVPASDKRGASQPRRVDGVPALGMRPQQVPAAPDRRSTRRTTREFIPVTARVNKKKGHSPRLYYAPRGVNIAPWGCPPAEMAPGTTPTLRTTGAASRWHESACSPPRHRPNVQFFSFPWQGGSCAAARMTYYSGAFDMPSPLA